MSPGIHVLSGGALGYVVPNRKCLACPVASGRAYADRKHIRGSSALKSFPVYNSKMMSFVCEALSNNHRRNPDFSRQQKGSSRGKSRQNQERYNSEDHEESDVLPSKNGPLLSLSSNQRYQATATPGRREKEIVELFRKVQAQLRARAVVKEEKKIEIPQQGHGEKGTVDSLLKLLRKHSLDQRGKSREDEDFILDQSDRNNSFEEETNPNLFGASNSVEEVDQSDPVTVSRPASSFRRRSPVPRVKFQPILLAEDGNSAPLKSRGKKKSVVEEQDLEPRLLDESDKAYINHSSDISDTDETYEGNDASVTEHSDLSSLKLSELRSLAKSRGMKGYSRLKKSELFELLSGDGA